MSVVPSIKGTVFRFIAEDVSKAIANGKIPQEMANRYLEQDDLVLMQRRILPVEWVDVRVYARAISLLRDTLGNGQDLYIVKRGARAAEALLESGVYGMLELFRNPGFRKATSADRFRAYGDDLRTMSKLSSTLNNFSHQVIGIDPDQPDRYRLEIHDAHVYPDSLAWANLGFLNRLFEEMGDKDLFRWSRVGETEIHYTMVRPPNLG